MERNLSGSMNLEKLIARENTEVNGLMIDSSGKVLAVLNSKMVQCIKVSLRIERLMEREEWPIQMVTFIKANGKMVKLMDMVYSWMLMVHLFMRVNGLMINKMDKVQRNGTVVPNAIPETLLKDRRQEKENLSSMVATMRETSLMDNSMVKESTTLLTQVRFMRGIS
jgi:hypothetical protein